MRLPKDEGAEGGRAYKERLVREGRLKEYNAGPDKTPHYRLTCFFVDRNYRRKGVAAVALGGAHWSRERTHNVRGCSDPSAGDPQAS